MFKACDKNMLSSARVNGNICLIASNKGVPLKRLMSHRILMKILNNISGVQLLS